MADPSPDPDDDKVNDIFQQMTEGLGMDEQAIVNMSDVTVSSLTDIEIVNRFNATKRELYDRQELLHPKTETGRDLQSLYHALLLEGRRRGLM